jgi:hypothetical protein
MFIVSLVMKTWGSFVDMNNSITNYTKFEIFSRHVHPDQEKFFDEKKRGKKLMTLFLKGHGHEALNGSTRDGST